MKVKLDENLGATGAAFLIGVGVDVATAAEQQLISASDVDIARICAQDLWIAEIDRLREYQERDE